MRVVNTVTERVPSWRLLGVPLLVVPWALAHAQSSAPVFPIARVQQAAMGGASACAVLEGGEVWCWGSNIVGQMGSGQTGSPQTIAKPTLITSGATQVAVGLGHACAAVAGGVQCWGNNAAGQLGDGSTTNSPVPVQAIAAGAGIVEVRAGNFHTCARTSAGAMSCWGRNFEGQLGDGTALPGAVAVSSPVAVNGISAVVSMALGNAHTCAVTAAGAAFCWGWNGFGQLGNNAINAAGLSTPTPVNTLSGGVAQLAAGGQHTCARTSAGAVRCWGDNSQGQLGDQSFVQRLVPTPVQGLDSGVTAISANDASSCAVTAAGVSCWGRGTEGQNGIAFPLSVTVPNPVAALGAGVTALTARGNSVCALLSGGRLQCWGDNYFSQLGRNYLEQRLVPTAIPGLWSAAVLTVAPGFAHVCVLKSGGGVECAGNNASGQLGDGGTTNSMVPVPVVGITGASAIASGWLHSCAVVDGRVRCWGRNFEGQLGDGTTTASNEPVLVPGLTNVTAIGAGAYHTCAVSGGALFCWGRNLEGQLGLGSTQSASSPQPVTALASGVASVHSGNFHTCALRNAAAGGRAFCWGLNASGQVGNGSTTAPVTTPVEVAGGARIAIATGAFHTCAVASSDGAVTCWGINGQGQLGTGNNTASASPIANGVTGAIGVSAGDLFSCARLSGGSVRCWGDNIRGQLGNGSVASAVSPVDVAGPFTAGALFSRLRMSCAITEAGGLSCWGWNPWGQFGDQTRQASFVPSSVLQRNPAVQFGDGFEAISPGP